MGNTRVTRKSRALQRLPQAVKEAALEANLANADDFAKRVAVNIPKGDPADGQLVDTLKTGQVASSETGAFATIGGPEAPHALHLEAGHRNKDGSHTPAKPYWYPTRRVMLKRFAGRQSRAIGKAIRGLTND